METVRREISVDADGRDSSDLEGISPSKKVKYDYYLPTPSQSTGSVEGSDERQVEVLVEGPSAPYTEGSSKMVESHPPATIEVFKQWVLDEEDIINVILSYVNIQTYDRRLKMYHRINYLNPCLYARCITSNRYRKKLVWKL